MTNSREKGKRGEREWAQFLRDYGFDARRGQQYAGDPTAPDVVSCFDDFIHWEVKRVQQTRLQEWMDTAEEDSGDDRWPVIAHRKNHQQWLCTMQAADFLILLDKAWKYEQLEYGDE